MLSRTGPLARIAGHCGGLLHRLLDLALGLVVLAAVCLGVLAWRLSQGPLELGWLAQRIEAAAAEDFGGPRIRIGSAAIAWEGFHGGVDLPLDIRLTGLRAVDAQGVTRASIPEANVSLSVGALLLGRLVPRAVEIDDSTMRVLRTRDGAVSLDLGATIPDSARPPDASTNPFDRVLTELALAPQTDRAGGARGSRLNQMRRLLIRDAKLTVVDEQLGATWRAPSARIDLRRQPGGGVTGDLDIQLALGAATARLTATAALVGGGTATQVLAHLSQVTPAMLADAAPVLAPLSAIDAPVTLDATLELGPALAIRRASLSATMTQGVAHIGTTSIQLRAAALRLASTPDGLALTGLRLILPSPGGAGAPDSVITATGGARRTGGQWHAEAGLDIDQLGLADLPALWPAGMAQGARKWILPNITGGTVRHGHVAVALDLAPDFSDATLTGLSGGISGEDVTVWWLRPIPPAVHGQATLTLDNTDSMTIAVQGGQQAPPSQLVVRDGIMRITGLSQHQQIGALTVNMAGPVADALAVLRQPRLHLFDRRPLDLRDPAGTATAQLSVTLPLTDKVTTDQIQIAAHAHLADVHLTGIVAGRDIDHGQFDLDVANAGLTVAGPAAIAGVPATLKAMLDFRDGPPDQITESVTASGRADAAQLAAAGLDTGGLLTGPAALKAAYTQRRDSSAELSVAADMAAAALGVSALGWRKAPGGEATASARILLRHDRIVGVDSLRADGDGLLIRGRADYADGRPNVLRLDQLVLGQTAAHGRVQFPTTPDQPIRVQLQGSKLDLAPLMAARAKAQPHAADETDTAGPRYAADVRFDEVLLAESQKLDRLSVQLASDGHVFTQARVEAVGAQHILAEIQPDAGGRSFSLTAGDGGALLRALGTTRAVVGGRLSVTGRFDDSHPGHPLDGVARMYEFRVNNAPVMGKVLQAMTLYGLTEALKGPGLGFTQMIAPFRLRYEKLDLTEARVFSASLGMTARGHIDLAAQRIDLHGTIVPAYFFNTLLGNVPLVGRLFSPEKDGGVFSATYAVSGVLDDPDVSVNPLAALTPGFLRGVFGIFDQPPAK